ncbi:GATA zinc finger domain-containing protein [Favolaschia claudopus]|uniref:GATA zinc finger domain-containing protein n=1 Tax=Favolaschia claudopus TaxID=2862362 RepID=A0AAW0CDT7_9AGAR
MSGHHHYSRSSGSGHTPRSNYSSLSNAVPANHPPSSSPGYYGGYPQSQPNSGYPSSQAYPQGYGTDFYGSHAPGYSHAPTTQYPATPYTSNTQYPGYAVAANMPYNASHQSSYASPIPPYTTTQHGAYASSSYSSSGPPPDPGMSVKQCYNCGKLSTPLWRRDPVTQRTLCNACGLYQQQRREPRPQALIDADNDEGEEPPPMVGDGPQCSHCGTRKTSVWRRNKDGDQVCNACGVYYRVNGRERPLSMPQSKVKPRAKHTPL